MPELEDIHKQQSEAFIKLLQTCTEVAVEPGLDIAIEVVASPTHSTIPTPRTFTLSITKKRRLKMEKEWDVAKFRYEDDFYGWRWIGHCFMIEDRHGEMLIGDQLPQTEDEARLLCRVANGGIRRGFKECDDFAKKIHFDLAYAGWVKAQQHR